MTEVGTREDIDYKHVSIVISQIGSKASRLRSKLALPKPEKIQRTTISNAIEFKSTLLVLDKSVTGFARNPIFQETSVIDIGLAKEASHDLATIIELSVKLKKVAERLGKR